jgi:hypothetical protein
VLELLCLTTSSQAPDKSLNHRFDRASYLCPLLQEAHQEYRKSLQLRLLIVLPKRMADPVEEQATPSSGVTEAHLRQKLTDVLNASHVEIQDISGIYTIATGEGAWLT